MANQIPLTSANAAGGFLIQPAYQELLSQRIARENSVFQLADTTRVTTNQVIWPVYMGRPTAAFVAEAGVKTTTGAEFGQLTANLKKIATKVRFTEEILQDAVQDPRLLVGPDVVAAINDLAEYNALGTHAGAANTTATFTTSFDSALLNTTSGGAHVEYVQANQDAMATAISAAIAKLEGNGYVNNLGILAGYRVKQALRDARTTIGLPLYTDSFTADTPGLYGLRWAFSTNLNKTDAGAYDPITTAGLIGGAGSPGKVVALVGDFSNAKAVIRTDISVDSSREAVSAGVSLWDTNQVELRYETRIGFQVYDLNNAFVKIVNAA
jgi:HK97 family phage major capsid protein